MNTAPTAVQNLTRRLLADASPRLQSGGTDDHQALRECDKLRAPLIRLAGVAGFASLLSRALAVARRQAPLLQTLRVGPTGSLEGFSDIPRHADSAEASRHAGAVLLAELLGLLFMLIGEPLTLSLVREAWPNASVDTTTLNPEDTA